MGQTPREMLDRLTGSWFAAPDEPFSGVRTGGRPFAELGLGQSLPDGFIVHAPDTDRQLLQSVLRACCMHCGQTFKVSVSHALARESGVQAFAAAVDGLIAQLKQHYTCCPNDISYKPPVLMFQGGPDLAPFPPCPDGGQTYEYVQRLWSSMQSSDRCWKFVVNWPERNWPKGPPLQRRQLQAPKPESGPKPGTRRILLIGKDET